MFELPPNSTLPLLSLVQARAGARSASGTPLSVLDPPGSTTIEQAYARIDDKLKVRAQVCFFLASTRRYT